MSTVNNAFLILKIKIFTILQMHVFNLGVDMKSIFIFWIFLNCKCEQTKKNVGAK